MIVSELFAKLGLQVEGGSFKKADAAIAGVKKGLALIVGGAAAAGAGLLAMIKSTANAGDKFAKASQKIGVGVESLQEIAHAAELSDVGFESLVQGLGFLNRAMFESSQGSKEQQETFKALGIKAMDAAGNLRPAEEVIGDLAEQFEGMPDGAKKTALAMKVFGRAGKDMIPLLNSGRRGIADMRKEARELGLVLSEHATKEGERFNDALTRVSAAFTGIKNAISEKFLTGFADALEEFAEFLVIVRKSQGFQDFQDGLKAVLVIALKVAGAVVNAFQGVGTALGETIGWIVVQFERFENFIERINKKIDEMVKKIPLIGPALAAAREASVGHQATIEKNADLAQQLFFGTGSSPESTAKAQRETSPGVMLRPVNMKNDVTFNMPPGSDGKDVVDRFQEYLRGELSKTHAIVGAD